MKKLIVSSVLVFSFIVCASAQQGTDSQKVAPAKSVQTVDKGSLDKKAHVTPPGGTNWSKIKDLFR